jgi:hypothetical protein
VSQTLTQLNKISEIEFRISIKSNF